MATRSREDLWTELEGIGEDEVRLNLRRHIYGDVGDKRALVEEWLRRKDVERSNAAERSSMEINLESLRTAKSAKNAAWLAAIAAIIAMIVSVLIAI